MRKLRLAAPALDISVDGGVNADMGAASAAAGANVLISGSHIFRARREEGGIAAAVRSLQHALLAPSA